MIIAHLISMLAGSVFGRRHAHRPSASRPVKTLPAFPPNTARANTGGAIVIFQIIA
jgi:hypothetical protein